MHLVLADLFGHPIRSSGSPQAVQYEYKPMLKASFLHYRKSQFLFYEPFRKKGREVDLTYRNFPAEKSSH